jgi:hypothetical protein
MAETFRHYLTNTSDPDDPLIVLARRQHEAVQRFSRPVGEQPEPAPVSVVGCPYCQRVPCEDQVHALWRLGLNGVET